MEKLFSKEDLDKIKSGSFDIQSLRKNGKELTACSFNRDCTGNILTSYIVKYEVNDTEVKDIFVSFGEKVNGKSMENCVNNSRDFLKNKHDIIIDSRGVGYGAIDILANDYLTDEGVLHKGIKTETSNKRFPKKIIPLPMMKNPIHIAIMELRDFIQNGRFHVDSSIYEEVINELSLIEYGIENGMITNIRCDKREYIDNILLTCEANNLL